MFSFFSQAPTDSGSSDDDEEQSKPKPPTQNVDTVVIASAVMRNSTEIHAPSKSEESEFAKGLDEEDLSVPLDTPASDATISAGVGEAAAFALKLQAMEERNKKMTKQLSALQGIITSKSSLYLEYKRKFEVRSVIG